MLSPNNNKTTADDDDSTPTCHLIDLEMARFTGPASASAPSNNPRRPHHHRRSKTPPPPPAPATSSSNDNDSAAAAGFKPGYVSPEVAARRGVADWHAADVWSLGICLYVMLTGRPLYQGPQDEAFVLLAQGGAPGLVHYHAKCVRVCLSVRSVVACLPLCVLHTLFDAQHLGCAHRTAGQHLLSTHTHSHHHLHHQ